MLELELVALGQKHLLFDALARAAAAAPTVEAPDVVVAVADRILAAIASARVHTPVAEDVAAADRSLVVVASAGLCVHSALALARRLVRAWVGATRHDLSQEWQ